MTSSPRQPIPILSSIAGLAERADAWIVDIWGVLHNGVAAFAPATAACRQFRDGGGTVVLVSNAPRPNPSIIQQLDGLGVPRAAYDAIVTSGDVTRGLIGELAGKPIFHLGPPRDLPLFEGLDTDLVKPKAARAIVCTGLNDDRTETPETYRTLLTGLHNRGVPMVCANPDLKVERGNQVVYCAGALAELYGAMGGKVTYAGKPYLPIYDQAFATIARLRGREVAKARILAIGDGVKTDLAGAHAAGLESVFVASGIHVGSALDQAALNRLFADVPFRPIAALDRLAW